LKATAVNKQKKFKLLESLCRRRGLPVTVQRRVILDALLDRDDHPTVDQVFEQVRARIPGVSRTTVYRTLETLVELGVAQKTNHFEAVARFDGNTDHHHHLVCVGCDKIVDCDEPSFSRLRLPEARRAGFDIIDFSVYFNGLCATCRQIESAEARSGGSSRGGKSTRRTIKRGT
jgi:Fur family transcriptional regulator, peroxide stress response regulator